MPNWCKNKLSIYTTSDEQMEEFLEFVGDGDNVFSLNKILPMPEALRRVQSPTKVATQEEINAYKEQYKATPYMMDSLPITQETCDALLNLYGVSNWYDWANEHWGTKWDTSDAKITESYPSEVYIDFDTAWGPPNETIKGVLEYKFPDISITWLWYEDGMQIAGYL